ncbi:hypothetical protein [Dethiosulfatarculus sandiegensis]|uniref:Uncharacterized protein n=1 Tax=Dethiosulfatarculus sandiegensis TaxID=1429043 RepID=A0A0D2JAP3_9BACT|nr:hypothetical protein [Dethiosulfatarculus sandiegensis]KIX15199.1 hypothetical protein X474_04805 [Dethiosulfatarculus sandiegensis]
MDIDSTSFVFGTISGIALSILIYFAVVFLKKLKTVLSLKLNLRDENGESIDDGGESSKKSNTFLLLETLRNDSHNYFGEGRRHFKNEGKRHEESIEYLVRIIEILQKKLNYRTSVDTGEPSHGQHDGSSSPLIQDKYKHHTPLGPYSAEPRNPSETDSFVDESSPPPDYEKFYVGRDSSVSLSESSKTVRTEPNNLSGAPEKETEPIVDQPKNHNSAPKVNDWSEEDKIWDSIYMEYNQMLTSADPRQQKEFLKKHKADIFTMLNYENRGKDLGLPPQLRVARERDREHFLALPVKNGKYLFLLSATASAENNVLITGTIPGKVPWLWGIFQAINGEKLEIAKPAIMQNKKIVRTGVVKLPQY